MYSFVPVIFGSILNVAGSSWYIARTIRGITKPNKMTFLLWTIAPMIGTIASLSAGVTWAVLPVFVAGFMPFCIFLASFVNPNAYWRLQRFDYVCGALSILALVLWAITKSPFVAILFAILSDVFAAIPTLVKAWKHPETESASGFAASSFNGLMGVVVAENRNFVSIAFPAYLFVMMGAVTIAVIRPRAKKV
jgi:hypothetical protein